MHKIKTNNNNKIIVFFVVRLMTRAYTIQRTRTHTKSHGQQARYDAVVACA